MKISEMVNEFAETTKQTPSRKLSLNLIHEEYLEFLDEARKTRVNRPYELKELADLVYVIYGYARVQGYDLDGAVEEAYEDDLFRTRRSASFDGAKMSIIGDFLGEANKTEIDPRDELKKLADMVCVVYDYAQFRDYDIDGAVKAVHENNLGRIRQPDGSIKRREDGKILKNPDYPKVNLNDYIGS
jgi:predicted HAD superfamily Cof-like phosphohydrolase